MAKSHVWKCGESDDSLSGYDIVRAYSNMCLDFLSLTGEGYIPSMYKKYGKVVSLMGRTTAHVKPCEPVLTGCLLSV